VSRRPRPRVGALTDALTAAVVSLPAVVALTSCSSSHAAPGCDLGRLRLGIHDRHLSTGATLVRLTLTNVTAATCVIDGKGDLGLTTATGTPVEVDQRELFASNLTISPGATAYARLARSDRAFLCKADPPLATRLTLRLAGSKGSAHTVLADGEAIDPCTPVTGSPFTLNDSP